MKNHNPQNMGNKGDTMSNTSSGKVKSSEVGYDESNVCPVDEIYSPIFPYKLENVTKPLNNHKLLYEKGFKAGVQSQKQKIIEEIEKLHCKTCGDTTCNYKNIRANELLKTLGEK